MVIEHRVYRCESVHIAKQHAESIDRTLAK